MSKVNFESLLEAGVHFGHLKRKWNPAMAPYIFEEKKGIHIIDLNKTIAHLDQACAAMKQIAKSGKKVLFVATKKQAKEIVAQMVAELNMPFVTERWSGGMLTNFQTTRKSIRKMSAIDKMKTDGTWETLNKRERLFKTRQREKLEKNFGSIADMTRQPAAIFIVDILKEHIALSEAKRLNIPTFGMVDTNSNPKLVDFPIPANDDATKSITIVMEAICGAIKEGLEDRKNVKGDKEESEGTAEAAAVATDIVTEKLTRKLTRKVTETAAEATTETAAETVTETVTESAAETATETTTETTTETATESATETAAEAAAESATESND